MTMPEDPCPHAWHMGLAAGILHECRYQAKHRGVHRNEAGDLSWSGKLTEDEMARANQLRGQA